MTIPTSSLSALRAATVNVIIDEQADSPFLASFALNMPPTRTPIRPANAAAAIGEYETTRMPTFTLTFLQSDDDITRMALELAASGESGYAPPGGVVPNHTLRINDLADEAHANDLLFHRVTFGAYNFAAPAGEDPGLLLPTLEVKAFQDVGGTHDGKVYTIGVALP